MSSRTNLDHIRIILVEPKEPGNIGAVARAMKNTGLSRLYLVNPPDHTSGDARAMAHGSGDILYGATVVSSLPEALADVSLAIGTSHRIRREFDLIHPPRTIADKLLSLPETHEGAIVFGREQNGLTNSEIQLCQMVTRIPSAVKYPSLNLSQATLIYGYELFQAINAETPPDTFGLDLAHHRELESMYDHIKSALTKLGFVSRHRPETFLRSIRRIFNRIDMEHRDVATVHRLFRQIDRFISRHDLDPIPSPENAEEKKSDGVSDG